MSASGYMYRYVVFEEVIHKINISRGTWETQWWELVGKTFVSAWDTRLERILTPSAPRYLRDMTTNVRDMLEEDTHN